MIYLFTQKVASTVYGIRAVIVSTHKRTRQAPTLGDF